MITVTIKEMLNIASILHNIYEHPFNGSTALKIARIIRAIEAENALFEAEKQKLIEKYGNRDKNGNIIVDAEGNVELQESSLAECNREMTEILNVKVELNANKIPLEVFSGLELSPSQACLIEAIVDFE